MNETSQEYQDLVEHALQDEAKAEEEIKAKIAEAEKYDVCNGMVPSVFKAITLDGNYHIGFNFQPVGTKVSDTFHYDHGVGIEKNQDAEVVWIKPTEIQEEHHYEG